LVSLAGAHPEVCGDAAMYFDPLNVHDIADKIIKVITDKPLSSRLKKKGFEQAKKFDWNTSAKKLSDIFEGLLNKSKNLNTYY
jgi:glycosyltransferase involved in cell wall biosynthesis